MPSNLSVPGAPRLHRMSQDVDVAAPIPAESRNRPLPGVDAALSGLSLRPRTGSGAEATSLAPRSSLPKARASALDAGLGPAFDRQLASELHPGLASYLNDLEAAYRENRTPEVKDNEHLKLIIEGLNKADPGLQLEHDGVMKSEPACWVEKYKLTQRLQQGLGRGDAWRMVIDDDDASHRYALSVQCSASSHDASLILVDSIDPAKVEDSDRTVSWNDILGGIGKVLRQRMPADPPVRLHLAVAFTTTLRANEGCCIHALSAARKMAAEPEIAELHGAALRAMDSESTGQNIVALPAADLPPSFFKHSTSRNDLLGNLSQRKEAGPDGVFNPVVNKDGQTLLDRWESHKTSRWDPRAGKEQSYSNSYEAKRIELIRTALAALLPRPTPTASRP